MRISDTDYLMMRTVENALIGAAQRLISLPMQFMAAFYPNELSTDEEYVQICPETLRNQSIFPHGKLPPDLHCSNARLAYVYGRVNAIAKAAGIPHTIEIYTRSTPCPTGCVGSKSSFSSPMLFLDVTILNLPDNQLDFVLHHEITGHIQQNHCIKNFFFSLTVALIDLVFWIHFPIGIFATEGIAFLANVLYSQYKETSSDKAAIGAMNSTEGAVGFFKTDIEKNLKIKNLFWGQPYPGDSRKNNYITAMKSEIDEVGNLGRDIYHPPLTVRLDYSKKPLKGRLRHLSLGLVTT